MSASDGIKPGWKQASFGYLRNNALAYFALFARKPRVGVLARRKLPLIATAAGATAAILLTMRFLDARSTILAESLPPAMTAFFDAITDYGRSGWFLVPIGSMIVLLDVVCTPSLPAMAQRVLAVVAVRLGFLFTAILLPGLIFTVVKRLIGRARPLVGGSLNPFLYLPMGWDVEYSSMPSGHAVNAFAAAAAFGLLWPKLRPLLWTYAVAIAVSRVALTAHYPSDVLAGALIGVWSVALIRDWFAARGLVFLPTADGRICPISGPSFARLRRVAGQLIAP